MNKAGLAIGDSFLILNQKYHYSYYQRLITATKLNFNNVPNGKTLKYIYLNVG